MATGLYGRVQARGFPVSPAYAGSPEVVAQASLEAQGGTADPSHASQRWGPPTSTLPGFAPEGPPPPQLEVRADIPGPGAPSDPNQSPGYGPGTFRSHAAPWPQPVLTADPADTARRAQESLTIHGVDFGGRKLQEYAGVVPQDDGLPMNPSGTEDYGASGQAPLSGAARVLGGLDSVQGYGGGGDGPGGVNSHGYSAVKARHQNVTGNVVNAYLDPADRPFVVPQAGGSFVPTDAVAGPEPFASMLAADGASWHDPSPYVPAPEPGTLQAPLNAAQAWGW